MKLPQQQEIIYMDGLGKLSVGSRNYLKPVVKPNKDVTIKVAELPVLSDVGIAPAQLQHYRCLGQKPRHRWKWR